MTTLCSLRPDGGVVPQPKAGTPIKRGSADGASGSEVREFNIGTPNGLTGEDVLEDSCPVHSERRMKTPDRAPAQKRKGPADKDSPGKRLITEDTGSDPGDASESQQPPIFDMQFEEEPTQGGSTQEDEMIGFFRGINVVDITEIFSPPRIARQCKAFGLRAGSSMDLMTGWNFDLEVDRERARRQVMEEKPTLLVGSPPCTYSPRCRSSTNTE